MTKISHYQVSKLKKTFLLIFSLCLLSCSHTIKRPSIEKSVSFLKKGGSVNKLVNDLAIPLITNDENTGMVIALVTPTSEQIFTYGYMSKEKKHPITPDTIFQIGSITKVFISHLLLIQQQKGILDITDPLSKFDKSSNNPDLKKATLEELASHTSGFPFIHPSFTMYYRMFLYLFTGGNLWKGYDGKQMLKYVSQISIEKDAPRAYKYSNLGYAYLGWLLGNSSPYKSLIPLLQDEIFDRYQLGSTTYKLNSEQQKRIATGYAGDYPPLSSKGSIIPPWSFHKDICSSGGLYSSGKDLLRYLKLHMSNDNKLLHLMQTKHTKKEDDEYEEHMGLAWHIRDIAGSDSSIIYSKGTIGGHKVSLALIVREDLV